MNLPHQLATQIASAHLSEPQTPYFVAICGWADTGKSTLAKDLCAALAQMGIGADWLSTDAFLKNRDERNALGLTGYNALSIDSPAMSEAIARIQSRQSLVYFAYDNRSGRQSAVPSTLVVQPVIVIEGIHAFHSAIIKTLHLRVFIDADESTLKIMRARANVEKRGMTTTDSEARIDMEFNDYCAFTLPLKSQAHILVKVSQEFKYSVLN